MQLNINSVLVFLATHKITTLTNNTLITLLLQVLDLQVYTEILLWG